MKNTLLSLLLGISLSSFSQNYCGTELSDEQITWLRNFQASYSPDAMRSGDIYYIPLKIHVVGDDDGEKYMDAGTILQDICDLNLQFAETGFYFYIEGDFHYIDNSDYYEHDWSDGYDMMNENNVNNAVNVYFVGDPSGNCGYFSPSGDAVAIANMCGGIGNSTIAHELGHFFSLPHTFYGWEGGAPPVSDQENVDGSNCNSAADGFCDTPADYANYRWFCSSPPSFTDPDGAAFSPDGSLFMSYADDACCVRFSEEQSDAMVSYLEGPRDYLLDHDIITPIEVGQTALVEPLNETETDSYNYVVFKWNTVENAAGYNLQISYTPSFSVFAWDVYAADTLYVATQLDPEKNYWWRVKPLGVANTCTEATEGWKITTGDQFTAIEAGVSISGMITLYPNPVKTGDILYVNLETAVPADGSVRIIDVTGKIITDQNINAATKQVQFQTANLAAGMYYVQIGNSESMEVRKIVIAD
ncbi:MAG: T9SS type A sorting domain-containing protein [Chitinophagales bacterium]|nr:T9SS type A sorting domain-containing protein [Chitinophagales bacterium]